MSREGLSRGHKQVGPYREGNRHGGGIPEAGHGKTRFMQYAPVQLFISVKTGQRDTQGAGTGKIRVWTGVAQDIDWNAQRPAQRSHGYGPAAFRQGQEAETVLCRTVDGQAALIHHFHE